MYKREKSTDWKIPLIFCGVIILLTMIIAPFTRQKQIPENIPPELLQKAISLKIDLHSKEKKEWSEQILAAASGFRAQSQKDLQLEQIVRTATENNQYDAAFAAIAHIRNRNLRENLAAQIFQKTERDCANLPWTIFALRIIGDMEQKKEMLKKINESYEQCGHN